jgi:hypothetical protein
MARRNRIAPIFPVRNLSFSLEYYGRLGFDTSEWDSGYGFATRNGVEIHLDVMADVSGAGPGSAYLWVEDADELAQTWRFTGADVTPPEDKEWGQHEGVLVDPDGNIIRFGSPVRDESTAC